MIFLGDCLNKLRIIKEESIDLIYLDPPFFTQKSQKLKSRDNSKEYSFVDRWESIQTYSDYIRKRLLECYRALKNTGSIFLHCDKRASHYLRVILDEVFGFNNFQSEIIWTYRRWSNSRKGLLPAHQLILFYSKTNNFKFHQKYTAYSLTTNIDQIFQKRTRDKNNKSAYMRDETGSVILMDQKKGVPLSDVWEIPFLNPKAKERVGYPTQKPIELLEKIIKLCTDKGDTVLDPFCGSGTTLVAAKLLNRKYIGIDILKDAVELARKRLSNPIKSRSLLLKNGKHSYLNQDKEILSFLEQIDAVPVQRNKGIDGFLKIENDVKPIPVRVQREYETIEFAKGALIKSTKQSGYLFRILIKTNNKIERKLFDLPSDKDGDKDLFTIDWVEKRNFKKKIKGIVNRFKCVSV